MNIIFVNESSATISVFLFGEYGWFDKFNKTIVGADEV